MLYAACVLYCMVCILGYVLHDIVLHGILMYGTGLYATYRMVLSVLCYIVRRSVDCIVCVVGIAV